METSPQFLAPRASIVTHPVTGEWAVVAGHALRAGTTILAVTGRLVSLPSKYTLQMRDGEHLLPLSVEPADPGSLWCFVNHSCEPNVLVDRERMVFVARRDIEAGEELTFDYCTTEDDLAAPFPCRCGAPTCYGVIRGYRHLTDSQRARLASSRAADIEAADGLSGRTESPRPR